MSKTIAKNLLFLLPFFFPFAQERVMMWSLPLYLHEIVIIFALVSFCSSGIKLIFPSKVVIIGSVSLFFGVIVSLFWNSPSLAGFGILKSWFFFPMLAALLFLNIFRERSDRLQFLFLWFLVDVVVAFFALFIPIEVQWTYDIRLKSGFLSPNHLAMFLEPGIIIGLFFLAKTSVSEHFLGKHDHRPGFFWILSGVVLLLFSIFLTGSKAAIISLAATSVLVFLFIRFPVQRASGIIFRGAILSGVIAIALMVFLWSDLSSGVIRSSLASRVMIWDVSAVMLMEHPFFGIGPGNFQKTYLDYQVMFPPYLEWAVPHPHNVFLAFWLNAGLLGLLGFLAILFSVIRDILARIRVRDLVFSEKSYQLLLLSFFTVIILHGTLDTPYFKNEYALFFWIFVAFSLDVEDMKSSRERRLL